MVLHGAIQKIKVARFCGPQKTSFRTTFLWESYGSYFEVCIAERRQLCL